jgi:hypothetical protein
MKTHLRAIQEDLREEMSEKMMNSKDNYKVIAQVAER